MKRCLTLALLLMTLNTGCVSGVFPLNEKPATPAVAAPPPPKSGLTPDRVTGTNGRESADALEQELNRVETQP